MALSVQIRYEANQDRLGAYPTITLAMARELTREANALRAQGIDPQGARREQQEQAKIAKMNTFELMARAWLESASKDRGNLETAQRVREAVQHVYQYAVDTGVLEPVQNFVNNRTTALPSWLSAR